jgi:glycosyltransferase involved in cell wall biosynthesis
MKFETDGAGASRARILVDLKPAFDGFAGIPQETRLLFGGLRRLDHWDVKGLLQHGSRRLWPALKAGGTPEPISQQIYRMSRMITSVIEKPYTNKRELVADRLDKYFALELLKARAALGLSVRHTVFDSRYFPDFVWRTLFDKTLAVQDRASVAYDDFCVLRQPRVHFQKVGLRSRLNTGSAFLRVDTRGFDFFVAQTPFPGRVSKGTHMVVRYHDAVPLLMPHTIKDKAFHQRSHYKALVSNIESGATFSCVSAATRADLLTLFPQLETRTSVVHNMVSESYFRDDTPVTIVPRLIRNRVSDSNLYEISGSLDRLVADEFEYLLVVGTLEPRKNHALLVSAWERLKYTTHPNLKLVVVGGVGWDEKPLLRAFRPWVAKGDLYHVHNVPAAELRSLYKHALVTVCPSLAEGFDYSGVEAMRCGSPVASSDIPVHREVYENGSAYFDPYSVDDAASCLGRLAASSGERADIAQRGLLISERYVPSRILPAWADFFGNLASARKTAA